MATTCKFYDSLERFYYHAGADLECKICDHFCKIDTIYITIIALIFLLIIMIIDVVIIIIVNVAITSGDWSMII